MSKKKHHKKRQFKASHSTPVDSTRGNQSPGGNLVNSPDVAATTTSRPNKPSRNAGALAGVDDFAYVGIELRRVLLMAAGLVVFEIILWYLLHHTNIGSQVYGLFKV